MAQSKYHGSIQIMKYFEQTQFGGPYTVSSAPHNNRPIQIQDLVNGANLLLLRQEYWITIQIQAS